MKKRIIISGILALLIASAGCGSDQMASDLADANAKLDTATKERDAAKGQLAQAKSASAMATTEVAELSKQLNDVKSQLADAGRMAANAMNAQAREHTAAEEKSRALLAENRELKDKLAKIAAQKPGTPEPVASDAPIPRNVRQASKYPVRLVAGTPRLDIVELAMGDIGRFSSNKVSPILRVVTVTGKEEMIVGPVNPNETYGGRAPEPFIIRGVSTENYATGSMIVDLPQAFEVQKTEHRTLADGGDITLFVAIAIDEETLRAKLDSYNARLDAEDANAKKPPAKSSKKKP